MDIRDLSKIGACQKYVRVPHCAYETVNFDGNSIFRSQVTIAVISFLIEALYSRFVDFMARDINELPIYSFFWDYAPKQF